MILDNAFFFFLMFHDHRSNFELKVDAQKTNPPFNDVLGMNQFIVRNIVHFRTS